MDKLLSPHDQQQLLDAIQRAKESMREMESKQELKQWAEIELPVSLPAILGRLNKNELSAIRSNFNMKGASSLKKQELIDAIGRHIGEAVPALLGLLDETRFDILKRVADAGGHMSGSLDNSQLNYFKERCLLFSGTYEEERTLVMLPEVRVCLEICDTPGFRETLKRNSEWIRLSHGMLYYYGALGLIQIQELVKEHAADSSARYMEPAEVLLDSATFYPTARLDSRGVYSAKVWDIGKLREELDNRSDLELRPFSKDELLSAGELGFMDRNAAYNGFVQFLTDTYTIPAVKADHIVAQCVYAIRNGEPLGSVMSFIQLHLEIESKELLEIIVGIAANLHNNTRQWALKGYFPHELRGAKEAVPAADYTPSNVIDLASRRKVGRNDPCPCGSGLKFKKCCGK